MVSSIENSSFFFDLLRPWWEREIVRRWCRCSFDLYVDSERSMFSYISRCCYQLIKKLLWNYVKYILINVWSLRWIKSCLVPRQEICPGPNPTTWENLQCVKIYKPLLILLVAMGLTLALSLSNMDKLTQFKLIL